MPCCKKPILHIDLETYSSVDLAACGVYKYAESLDFKILLFGYAWNDDPVEVLDLTKEDLPFSLASALADENITKVAHNANFERVCLTRYVKDYAKKKNILGDAVKKKLTEDGFLPPEQWKDTMIMAAENGYPSSLGQLGPALGIEEDKVKLATGKRLIQYFCKPCKPTKANGGRWKNLPEHDPEKWNLFIEYNKRDVESEQAIYNKLNNLIPVSDQEWENWHRDQRINDRGIHVDTQIIKNVQSYSLDHGMALMDEARYITGLENPQSVAQLKKWILDQEGHDVESLNKEAVKDLLKGTLRPETRRALEIRQELGKTSVKKYDAFQRACGEGDRIRGTFQFFGGRTGRWAGRLIQPQNFPRPSFDEVDEPRTLVKEGNFELLELIYPSMNDVFATILRTVITPPEGSSFIVADYSAIEARVIAWLTRTTWRQEVFKNGGDIYCASASQMFGVPVEKHGINGHLRQKGKIAELALGYGGGTAALEAFGASKMGLSPEQQQEIVTKWRQASPRIKDFWYLLGRAFEDAITDGKVTTLDRNMKVFKGGSNVYISLPNRRILGYVTPRIKDGQVSFLGLNQTTRKWEWTNTWGGKLTENVVQAIARDCLCETLKGCDEIGAKTIMHVHDEVICEVPTEEKETKFKQLLEVMAKPIDWAPDLVLVGDGFISDYYKKD
jgi:DNA polymerase